MGGDGLAGVGAMDWIYFESLITVRIRSKIPSNTATPELIHTHSYLA